MYFEYQKASVVMELKSLNNNNKNNNNNIIIIIINNNNKYI